MAEKRLIDANRALEIVRDQGIAHPSAYHLTNYATLILREAPTIDAVPVVRCHECIYFEDSQMNEKGFLICPSSGMEITDMDFCSYGERKEGAE